MKRTYGRSAHAAKSVAELRAIAQRRLPAFAFEYLSGGAEEEWTLQRNRAIFRRLSWVPRTLVDTVDRSLGCTLWGKPQPLPLVVAPMGLNGLHWHHGDSVLAGAAAAAGIPFTLSTVSNESLETVIGRSGAEVWLQLYLLRRREITDDLLARAQQHGCETLVLTSDANLFGNREWDRRNYRGPGQLSWRNLLEVACHPRWVANVLLRGGIPRFANIAHHLPANARTVTSATTVLPPLFEPTLDWQDLERLRQRWQGRLLLKGVLSPQDAVRAFACGCDGVVITNHGGRQLDGCVSPLEMLPAIRRAVGPDPTLLIDSGFRRGGDILKAIALGANAVMIGRPLLYGLAADGATGARQALTLLTQEMDRTLGQLGVTTLAALNEGLLRSDEPAER